MSFNEKLQKLRKENKYSQEELADKLDVTRQSVSKWESGQTYPEMDKLLAICKIFNCSLDELTNDEINEVRIGKKEGIDSLIDSVLELIGKTYKMFTNMHYKEIIRCIIIMTIVALILSIFSWPIHGLENAFYYMVDALGRPAVTNFCSSLFNLIIDFAYAILSILLFVYIFKIGFLDKYEFVTTKEADPDPEIVSESKKEVGEEKSVITPIRREHEYTIFKILGSIAMFFIKIILVGFSLPFLGILLALFAGLVITIYLMTKGVFFISILLLIVFGIILAALVIEFISNITFNKKSGYKRMLITFLVSMAGLGAASGILVIEINEFKYIDTAPEKLELSKEVYEYDFNDKMTFEDGHYYLNVNYVPRESLKDKVVVEVEYYKEYNNLNFSNWDNRYYAGYSGIDLNNYKNYFNLILEALKRKEFYNYNELLMVKVTICTSEANITKMKTNLEKYYAEEARVQEQYNSNQEYISGLENQIYSLQERIDNQANEKEELLFQIEELKEEIREYKDRVKSILD